MNGTTEKKKRTPKEIRMGRNGKVIRLRELIWVVVMAACLITVYLTPLRDYLAHLREFHEQMDEIGYEAVLVFLGITIVIIAIGFPRVVMFPIGGVCFGFLWGMIWTLTGVFLGSYLTFLYARWAGKGFILRTWPRMLELARFFRERSFRTVIVFRMLPTPNVITNAFLGITHIRQRSYLLGSAIGGIPSAIPATLIGSSMIEDDQTTQVLHVGISVLVIALTWTFLAIYVHRSPKFKAFREQWKHPAKE